MLKSTNVLLNYGSLTAPAAVSLTFLSDAITQITGGSMPSTVTLPDTSTCELGVQYEVQNDSLGIVTVSSFDASPIISLAPGLSATLTCQSLVLNTTSAWFFDSSSTPDVSGNCIMSSDFSSQVCANDGGLVDIVGNVSIQGNVDMHCQSLGNVMNLSVANMFGKSVIPIGPTLGDIMIGGNLNVFGNVQVSEKLSATDFCASNVVLLTNLPALVTPNNYHASLKNVPVGGIYRSFVDDPITPTSFSITSSFVSSGTTLTVTATSGGIAPGMFLSGGSVTSGTQIISQLTGTPGSTGTYEVDITQLAGVTPDSVLFQTGAMPDILYIRTA